MLQKLGQITNASKAQIIVTVNAVLSLLAAFDVVLTQAQLGAIGVAVNAVLGLIVALTYTQSSKRIDPPKAT
jgi:hypothetical protein